MNSRGRSVDVGGPAVRPRAPRVAAGRSKIARDGALWW